MSLRLAVLSNVNMNFLIRMLKSNYEVYESEGYGNELGILLNPNSDYHAFSPDFTFMLMDLLEVLEHDLKDYGEENPYIENWFSTFESSVVPGKIYYVSDAYLWGAQTEAMYIPGQKHNLENAWLKRLEKTCSNYSNVRIFPYHKIIEKLGEDNSFSLKMWYMGKMMHSNDAIKKINEKILETVKLYERVPKKVLLLDLDNTLWGGLAGEHEITPIVLSDDHTGLAYKNLQRVIKLMQESGVILGIVSKNNEQDAMEIIRNHPHMVLREDAFAIMKINWENKHENIAKIATELNLGMDSFVFFDDNPTERELIKQMLPEVIVPDFPKSPEGLAGALTEIYKTYFEKPVLTKEDFEKTTQYVQNAKRTSLQNEAKDFDEYLKQLDIKVKSVPAKNNIARLTQLINKTNQFNLTTKRYEETEILKMVESPDYCVMMYQVMDRFGDNGIVSAVIVECKEQVPLVDTFVMSCRVMGKRIENAIMEDVETKLLDKGYKRLKAMYLQTAKNKPVENLFESLGYSVISCLSDGGKAYEIDLNHCPKREYCAKIE